MEASTDAALPALGISLLDADDSQGSVTELLPSGCEPIDAALSGGVRYQEITAIAAFNQESRSVVREGSSRPATQQLTIVRS